METKKIRSRRIKKLFVVDEDGEIKELSGQVSDVKSLSDFVGSFAAPKVENQSDSKPQPSVSKPKQPKAPKTPFNEVKRMLTQIYNDTIPKADKQIRKQLPIITFTSKIAKHIINACCYKALESDTIQNKDFLTEVMPIATEFINNAFANWMVNFVNGLRQPESAAMTTDNLLAVIDEYIQNSFNTFYQSQDRLIALKMLYDKYKIAA